MKRIIAIILICTLVVSILIIGPKGTLACSCAMKNQPQEKWKKSIAVFQGKVIKKKTKSTSFFTSSSDDPVYVTFQVQKVWKGVNSRTVTIKTAISGASCGYDFRKNIEYVVYAKEENDKLVVNLCSRTEELSKASEDINYLGKPKKEGKDLVLIPEKTLQTSAFIIPGVLVIFLLLTAIIFIKRRRKQ
ncbi:hypothetical protein [Bacillus sp. FJAT-49736]|uniref:hypothetical protein n=1 Tax=Bacillus sp. FJAT-49736 TaxID=2833582 RepID=UPI001BC9EC33|nr:hypothetical protein [Bacillus sp. FJAT-49736]MBS4175459.1 hypothetical protein [Bacillus sp. FJAT-49736]